MSFTTIEQFFEDFRIKNNQQPNETVLNRGLLRLKREIRELKTLIDLIQGKEIEEWNESKIYEIDEYVMYNGLVFKSNIDTNFDKNPQTSGFWTLQTIDTVKNKNSVFEYNTIVSSENQLVFNVDFTLNSRPAVFIEGLLIDAAEFTWNSNSVTFVTPVANKRRVTIISGIAYENTLLLPKREFKALDNQYVFNTPFKLTNPSVFVDGLLQNDTFFYGDDYVEFYEPLTLGQEVIVINGFTSGLDTFTKVEIEELLSNYYKKNETYSKQESDTRLQDVATSILNDDSLAKVENVYTKVEVNDIIRNFASHDEINNIVNGKADIADTLQGYGINDAYTKTEVDTKLKDKLDSAQFTKSEILSRIHDADGDGTGLSATTLQGIFPTQFMRADRVSKNIGGLTIDDDVKPDVTFNLDPLSDIPEYGVCLRDKQFSSLYQPSYNGFNSNGLYYICEGEFKGTWWSDLREFGVPNYKDYNWIVEVHHLGNSTKFDFVPKNYGCGFEFKAFNQSKTNDTAYQYGFVDGSIVKLYSYARKDDNSFIKIPSHYKLIGIKKTISTFKTRNQDDVKIDYIQFNGVSNDEFEMIKQEAGTIDEIVTPSIENDNALSLQNSEVDEEHSTNIYESTKKITSELKFKVEKDDAQNGAHVIVYGASANADVVIEVTGGLIENKPSTFDQQGCLIFFVEANTSSENIDIVVRTNDMKNLNIKL